MRLVNRREEVTIAEVDRIVEGSFLQVGGQFDGLGERRSRWGRRGVVSEMLV